jgi:hypothetical protein
MERDWLIKHCASIWFIYYFHISTENALTDHTELGDAYMSLFYTSIDNRPSNLIPENTYLVEL